MTLNIAEEIKRRLVPSVVIGRYVKLKKAGGSYTGLCPFHHEKSPSFNVNDDKGFYHCFGCGAGGDVINFVMEIEKLDFIEACKNLAELAGINWQADEKVTFVDSNKDLFAVLDNAKAWFAEQLQSAKGFSAREYLTKRGIGANDIQKFGFGYSGKSGNTLGEFLRAKGFSRQIIQQAGLETIGKNQETYDYFRERITFPIFDNRNRVIAFGARCLDNSQPKYLNSPENPIFKKGEVLYGENWARKSAIIHDHFILVEGYMDVIALHKAGYTQAVATLGTAVTKQHFINMWKFVNNAIVCLDGDASGQKAMLKVIDTVLPLVTEEKSVRFCILPSGLDPDDMIRQNGAPYFQKLLDGSLTLSELMWHNESFGINFAVPENVAMLEKNLAKKLEVLANNSLKRNYNDFFRNKIWAAKSKMRSNKKTVLGNKIAGSQQFYLPKGQKINIILHLENVMLAQIIDFPHLLSNKIIYEDLIHMHLQDRENNEVRDVIIESMSRDDFNFYDSLQAAGLGAKLENLCGKESIFSDKLSKLSMPERENKWLLSYKKYTLSVLNQEFASSMSQLSESAMSKAEGLLAEIKALEKEINKLEYAFAESSED